jgi:hypothetical protein
MRTRTHARPLTIWLIRFPDGQAEDGKGSCGKPAVKCQSGNRTAYSQLLTNQARTVQHRPRCQETCVNYVAASAKPAHLGCKNFFLLVLPVAAMFRKENDFLCHVSKEKKMVMCLLFSSEKFPSKARRTRQGPPRRTPIRPGPEHHNAPTLLSCCLPGSPVFFRDTYVLACIFFLTATSPPDMCFRSKFVGNILRTSYGACGRFSSSFVLVVPSGWKRFFFSFTAVVRKKPTC